MKVYFIRHGQSEGNRLHLHCGWSDTPLSELGHQQARAANAYLKDIPFDRIYCSDLPRARQTADVRITDAAIDEICDTLVKKSKKAKVTLKNVKVKGEIQK